MHCTIENKHLPALRSLCEPPKPAGQRKATPNRNDFMRIAVTENGVEIDSPYGGMMADSRVKKPGVAFVPADEMLRGLRRVHSKHYIEIEASPEKIKVNGYPIDAKSYPMAFFADPATAPQHWCNR